MPGAIAPGVSFLRITRSPHRSVSPKSSEDTRYQVQVHNIKWWQVITVRYNGDLISQVSFTSIIWRQRLTWTDEALRALCSILAASLKFSSAGSYFLWSGAKSRRTTGFSEVWEEARAGSWKIVQRARPPKELNACLLVPANCLK